MAIEVETKDCTALGDAEMAEMADLCADGPAGFDIGLLSKQREEWVLITLAREAGKLHGFSFCTLERIGGTPVRALGPGLDQAHRQAGRGAQGDHRPTSSAGPCWPSPTRTSSSAPGSSTPPGSRPSGPGGHRAPPRPQGQRRGAGLESAPGQALRRRGPDRRPHLRGHGRRQRRRWTSTRSSPRRSTSRWPPTSPRSTAGRHDCVVAFGWAMADDLASRYGP